MKKNIKKKTEMLLQILRSFEGKPFSEKQLRVKLMATGEYNTHDCDLFIAQMVYTGDLLEVGKGRYQAVPQNNSIEGVMDINLKGNGYLVPFDGSPDIFIHNKHLYTAMQNDRVRVAIIQNRNLDQREGMVEEILERAKTTITGILKTGTNSYYIIPDDKRIYFPLPVSQIPENMPFQLGAKVQARIKYWKVGSPSPELEIIQILGKPGLHETEMNAIILEYGFSSSFPTVVEQESEKIPSEIDSSEIKKRRDFRQVNTFTIDPEDAKDFDDAISYQLLKNGNIEIGVHIADVSHYVKEGSTLDLEAYQRGTSVYLVDRTVPMLPERLSNDLCSLKPHVDRLTFSAVFELDENGNIINEWFGKTIIHSQRRFSYEEAQGQIESGKGDQAPVLQRLNHIARLWREKRMKNGAINFETDEVKFKLDKDGKPLGVYLKIRKDAHKMIEEYMLMANKKVAEFVYKSTKNSVFVYRTHDYPQPDKVNKFNIMARRFGYNIDVQSQKSLVRSFNKIIHDTEGKPEQNIVRQMAIRTMAKAIYTSQKTSHYGLAFDFYTHFTSPIRRYPDLMVHRLLEMYLNKRKPGKATDTESRCKHATQREIQATEAERASIRYKQVEFLKEQIGTQFNGVISGLTDWGIFVEIPENKCEGMVRIADIPGDQYQFIENKYMVIGRRTKRKFEMGQPIKVQVAKADMEKRQLDFRFIFDN